MWFRRLFYFSPTISEKINFILYSVTLKARDEGLKRQPLLQSSDVEASSIF